MGAIHSPENPVLTSKTKGLHISEYRRIYTLCSSLKGHNMRKQRFTSTHLLPLHQKEVDKRSVLETGHCYSGDRTCSMP